MTAVEVLVAARGLIDTPEKWFGGGSGELREGQLCAWQAIDKAASDRYSPLVLRFFRSAIQSGIVDWNDAPGRTHAEVLAAFDRAIELARAGETQ